MAKIIMTVTGGDGQIELMSDRIVIHRKGLFNMIKFKFKGRKEIPLSAVSTLNFRDANMLRFGEIEFSYAGAYDEKENKVTFSRKQQDEFVKLKEKIFELMQPRR